MPYRLLTQNQTTGSLKTLEKLRDSWNAPMFVAPSPNMQKTTSFAFLYRTANPPPVARGRCPPTMP